jgi:zona occludens toxin
MIYLTTGTPGAGKTINTIKYVQEVINKIEIPSTLDKLLGRKPKHSADEKRQVYYYNIKELNPALGWIELTEEQVKNWYELPTGSIIVIDEAYDIFPVRHGAKEVPEHVRRLATHRHGGYDVFLIMQKVNGQIDPFIRGLVGQHHHYERVFGSLNVARFVWPRCNENPDSRSARKDSLTEYLRIDKKYYEAYKSAEEHTHRLLLPKFRFILFFVALLFLAVMGYKAYSRFTDRDPVQPASVEPASPAQPFQRIEEGTYPGNSSGFKELDEMTFTERYTPEIPSLPWTAPMYREIIQPTTWPRPAACAHWLERDLVVCYSQQGTRMNIPREMALQIVKEGFFDWTKEEQQYGQFGAGGGLGEATGTPSQPATRAYYLSDNSHRMNSTGRSRPSAGKFSFN